MRSVVLTDEMIGEWKNLNEPEEFMKRYQNFVNRNELMKAHFACLACVIPECFTGSSKYRILDMSCGSGSMLEIMRMFGHEIQGTDYDLGYQPFIRSQDIPFMRVDGNQFPYPFEDNSYDIVINWGAITFLDCYKSWRPALEEFYRIAGKTVVLAANRGGHLDGGINVIEDFAKDKKVKRIDGYKWRFDK